MRTESQPQIDVPAVGMEEQMAINQGLLGYLGERAKSAKDHLSHNAAVLGASAVALVGGGITLAHTTEAFGDHEAPHQVIDGKEYGYPDNPSGLRSEYLLWNSCKDLGQRSIGRIQRISIGRESRDAYLTVDREAVPEVCEDYVDRQTATVELWTKRSDQKRWHKDNDQTETRVNNTSRENYRIRADIGRCPPGRTIKINPRIKTAAVNTTYPPQDSREARNLQVDEHGAVFKEWETRYDQVRVRCPSR